MPHTYVLTAPDVMRLFSCDYCGARPGSPCRSRSGLRVYGEGSHRARYRAAESARLLPMPYGTAYLRVRTTT